MWSTEMRGGLGFPPPILWSTDREALSNAPTSAAPLRNVPMKSSKGRHGCVPIPAASIRGPVDTGHRSYGGSVVFPKHGEEREQFTLPTTTPGGAAGRSAGVPDEGRMALKARTLLLSAFHP